MAWSNTATRTRFMVEKSHSLSFAVRVEDRLHSNIIQPTDKCWFTVRPTEYEIGVDDTDITVGTATVPGDGISADGVIVGTGDTAAFQFTIDAAELNLDPELDYWYDITYVRDGYSLSVAAGEFLIEPNVTNRGAKESAVSDGNVFEVSAGVQGRNILHVTSSMPMPRDGDPGNGSYVIARALSGTVGSGVTIPLSEIAAPQGRSVQVGDVIFSSITRGVLATIQSISTTGTPSAYLVTRQVYGQETLKALLDTELHIVPLTGTTIETIDQAWTLSKANVPLPPGYEYRTGDMVFSHSAISGYAVTKKMLISLIESQTATDLNVRTKVVFPMFLDTDDIEDLLNDRVPSERTINSKTLGSDVVLTEDDIPAGTTNAKFTSAQNTKLNALPTKAQLDTSLAGKAATAHTHPTSAINGLDSTLSQKVGSTEIGSIKVLTQAAYDALTTKLNTVLYVIKG